MTTINEYPAFVFLVPFRVAGGLWSARVRVTGVGDKQVMDLVHAMGPDEEVLTGSKWERLLAREGVAEAFWAEAVFHLVTRLSGGADFIGVA